MDGLYVGWKKVASDVLLVVGGSIRRRVPKFRGPGIREELRESLLLGPHTFVQAGGRAGAFSPVQCNPPPRPFLVYLIFSYSSILFYHGRFSVAAHALNRYASESHPAE